MKNVASVRRVLFVDDDPDLLEGVTNILRKEPYRVLVASSGQKALKVLARFKVDVVVSDERMPGMAGSDFLGEVCREYPRTVRLLLTGQASVEAAMRAVNEGQIFRFLAKPLAPSELVQNVRSAMALAELLAAPGTGLPEAQRRHAALTRLERHHPGISVVERSVNGAVVISETPPALGSDFDET
jgi:two-component system, probable response regulator PhcQ